MSKIEDIIYDMLREAFPNFKICRQFYVNVDGCKLFFDFYLPNFNLLIEVQGDQHYKYCNFFHSNKQEFYKSKHRDSLKEEWSKGNGYVFVKIDKDIFPDNHIDLLDIIYQEIIK